MSALNCWMMNDVFSHPTLSRFWNNSSHKLKHQMCVGKKQLQMYLYAGFYICSPSCWNDKANVNGNVAFSLTTGWKVGQEGSLQGTDAHPTVCPSNSPREPSWFTAKNPDSHDHYQSVPGIFTLPRIVVETKPALSSPRTAPGRSFQWHTWYKGIGGDYGIIGFQDIFKC